MLGISALINVSANCPNHFVDSFLYKSIPVEDNHKANISSWFNEAIEFIGEYTLHFYPLHTPPTAKFNAPITAVTPEPANGKQHKHPTPPLPSQHSLTPGFKFKKGSLQNRPAGSAQAPHSTTIVVTSSPPLRRRKRDAPI